MLESSIFMGPLTYPTVAEKSSILLYEYSNHTSFHNITPLVGHLCSLRISVPSDFYYPTKFLLSFHLLIGYDKHETIVHDCETSYSFTTLDIDNTIDNL